MWSAAAPLPEAVQEFHGAVLNGRIYVAGGIVDGNQTSAKTWRYDPATNTWEQRASLPAPRHHMPLAVVGDSLYAIGGLFGTDFEAHNNLWLYLEAADQWVARPGPQIPRGASAAAVLDGKIYLFGGYTGGFLLVPDVEVYDAATATWSQAAPLPTRLDHLAGAAIGGHIYALCGRAVLLGNLSAIVQRYDPEANRWEHWADAPVHTSGHAAAVLNGRIHLLGGEGAVAFDYHVAFDPNDRSWMHFPPLPTRRHGLAAAVVGGRLFAIGGGPQAGFSQTTVVEVFDADGE